ncbi:hypothetical protein [Rhodanobacter sp. L36]|uniref:hypothetical protein n=1 Tax=Rhodanobacter sp. L36 TaxID=1747221 RepID=UPI00131CD567|nr:hypothetical protein [Rhodanobacter sp. L36]
MKLRTLTKVVTFLVGTCIALLGVVWLLMAASGAVKTDPVAGYIAGVGFLLAAAPLLAFPFSTRVAKSLLVLATFVLAFGMLWLAFQPNSPTGHPAIVQVAAIAFAVMLLARVVLVLRRKRSALGT